MLNTAAAIAAGLALSHSIATTASTGVAIAPAASTAVAIATALGCTVQPLRAATVRPLASPSTVPTRTSVTRWPLPAMAPWHLPCGSRSAPQEPGVPPGPPLDAERATHGDLAATPQVSFEQVRGGVRVRQYQLGCLSHLSYLVVEGADAAVIDPQRDVDHYLRDAKALGATIRQVWLTHPHADFVAGHLELAHAVGAEVLISKRAQAQFAHHALVDDAHVQLGAATFIAWDTPGHTPDASTILLQLPGQAVPEFAFTGDTLFVGSIGRPDLLDKPPAELASQSFDSIQRLATLPDATIVLPAHGAGSLCGAHLRPATTSTIGAEKESNPFLRIRSRSMFVSNVLAHQPIAPRYFAMNVAMNRNGPPLVERGGAPPAALDAAAVRSILDRGGWVVDLRDQHSYAGGHVPGSINIALRGRLDTWMGIVVPVDAPLVLVGSVDEVLEGAFRLRRIGYDRFAGQLAGGVDAWRVAGGEVRVSKLVAPRALHAAMQAGIEPILVDVRTRDEFSDLRIGDIGNLPVTESERFARTLDPSQPVVMICNSAYRSSMAVGLAERLGFADVGSLDGGLDAWIEAGLPVIGNQAPAKVAPAASAAPIVEPRAGGGDAIALPEPVDSALLARVLMLQPEAYALLDLRPAWQFAEWHVPGSTNVALERLAEQVRALPAPLRIVLVDRDGSTAFAAAGALLARDPQRPLRVLLGGLQAFYRDTMFGGGAGGPVAPAAQPATMPQPVAPAAGKPQTKKRSAGC